MTRYRWAFVALFAAIAAFAIWATGDRAMHWVDAMRGNRPLLAAKS